MRGLPTVVCCICCCAVVSAVGQKSIRDIDWKNFSYPLAEIDSVPGDVLWMPLRVASETATLSKGEYALPDCSDEMDECPLVTFDSVRYGTLTGIESTVAAVVLTYHSGGTAGWQYVYLFALKSGQPRLIAWLRTGSRAYQGLREVSMIGGDLVLAVNDPDKRSGDCCSYGTITTRYRWQSEAFSAIGQPDFKTDPPSFDCKKAGTPVERLICRDGELAFLDEQMDDAYRKVVKEASPELREIIRQQQAEWFSEYSRACNAPLSETDRKECIDDHLNDRLMTLWK